MKTTKSFQLPTSYQAAVLAKADAQLEIQTNEFGALKKGQVWVQMKAAPINPSDLAMVAGTYPHQKEYPFVPGLEGSGIVVASGGGLLANRLLGKRVACSPLETGNGTWAEYMKTSATKCIPLNKRVDFEQGACALVNPLTALVLIKKVKARGNCFVNTAAAGALGKMMIKLGRKNGLTSINLVRQNTHIEALNNIGGDVVLNTESTDFTEAYQAACAQHQPQTILDAVGGTFTDKILSPAPVNCKLIAYASLGRENISISPQPILRDGKTIEGFHLGGWLKTQSLFTKIQLTRHAQKRIADGTLQSPIHHKFGLQEINFALHGYKNDMSPGKWILIF